MAESSRGRDAEQILVSRKRTGNSGTNDDREVSPGRTRVWTEPNKGNRNGTVVERRVPVVYYLSRNGQLEHPHFMEVPLSSNQGLFLRDVINRLNQLRGNGMASLYSWSAKRSYKNGFVWHDLSEDDLIHASNHNHHHQEYVLKGSEVLLLEPPPPTPLITNHEATSSFRYPKSSPEDSDFPVATMRRRNQSWSSVDLNLNEYKVYKAVESSSSESTRRLLAADASTQTEEKRGRRRRHVLVKQEEEIEEVEKTSRRQGLEERVQARTGDEIEEVSPPPSDSSPETLETLMKADGRLILTAGGSEGVDAVDNNDNRTGEGFGRTRASALLMQLISCGSLSFRNCGATAVKQQGLALIGGYKGGFPRGRGGGTPKEIVSFPGVRLEDKEYFSGSLVETKKGVGVQEERRWEGHEPNVCQGERRQGRPKILLSMPKITPAVVIVNQEAKSSSTNKQKLRPSKASMRSLLWESNNIN